MKKGQWLCLVVAALFYLPDVALTAEPETFTIVIKEHKFEPAQLEEYIDYMVASLLVTMYTHGSTTIPFENISVDVIE